MTQRKLPKLDDLMSLLGEDEVLRTAREFGLQVSLPIGVLDRIDITPVRAEIVSAARQAVQAAIFAGIYTNNAI